MKIPTYKTESLKCWNKAKEIRNQLHDLSDYDLVFINLGNLNFDIPRIVKQYSSHIKIVGILECNISIMECKILHS